MSEMTRNRRRFQFTLRTLFVAVTVVAIVSGWYVYHRNWIRQRHAFLEEVARREWEREGLIPNYPFAMQPFEGERTPYILYAANCRKAPWSLRALGEADVPSIVLTYDKEEDQGQRLIEIWREIELAQRLFPEADVYPVLPGRWTPWGAEPRSIAPLPTP